MSQPKRHHFVPQMLLKRFADSNNQLHFYSKDDPKRGVHLRNPKTVFAENHLYTQYDKAGNKDVTVEGDMAALESRANDVIEKIVEAARAQKIPGLSTIEKATWDEFFYFQWKRTPDALERSKTLADFSGSLAWAIKEFETKFRPLTDSERADFQDPSTQARLEKNARVKAVADPGKEVQPVLASKGLGVVVLSKPNKSFVIGSLPIVKFTLPGRGHLSDPTVEVWFPIASDVVVSPGPWPGGEERLFVGVPDDHVRTINEAIYKQSTMIAGRSAALIRSITGFR